MELTLRNVKGQELTYDEMDNNLIYLELNSTQYIFVKGDDTPTKNGKKLKETYITACSKTPNGLPLSSTNRFTVIVGPGKYNINLELNKPYIDLISLTGNMDIFIDGEFVISANDIYVRGIDCSKKFKIKSDYPLTVIEKCKAKDSNSFCIDVGATLSSTLIDCEATTYSFGYKNTTTGTLIRCVGGDRCFSSDGFANGTYIDCSGGTNCFGSGSSGTFTNCVSGNNSFKGTASGTYINCTAGDNSFSNKGDASGTFTNCVGGNSCFCSNSFDASGVFNNCVAGTDSFGGGYGNASGTFTNCVAGDRSFANSGTMSGELYFCRLTTGKFNTSSSAKIYYCINGEGKPVSFNGVVSDPSAQ